MARKKKSTDSERIPGTQPSAPVITQLITETIEENYMPYVMSVIVSRAIPAIDGFKPAHRKLLYTMYKMGLMTGARIKSTNVVGQTMRLNPHGDAAIYDTLVRLTRGNAALLHPFIDSKGAFGKQYSSTMAPSAPRYTEVKLDKFSAEIFSGIDRNSVEMVDNYDGTMKEPTLMPTTFPNILVTPNMGIAVGMASNICSFNLAEVCDGTIALLRNPKTDTDKLLDLIKAPDFSGGGQIIYNRDSMREIYETGSGSVRIRAKYKYDPSANCIDILEIPYSTSIEQIIKRISDLIKEGKLKEITDFRDEIGLTGFRLTIDIRKGTDPDQLMAKLFRSTPLEDSFKCNFNVLIGSVPRQMGVRTILEEWIKFRMECYSRELRFDLERKKEKLHLLLGLGRILLDIDKAIKIIRGTEKESDVIPNLCAGFSIDEAQAEFIADIKLRNINREYILKRTEETDELEREIAELEDTLASRRKLRAIIISELQQVMKKYPSPRRSVITYAADAPEAPEEDDVEDYPVNLFLSREGYFKKITPLSLRMGGEQKYKENDGPSQSFETTNRAEMLVFTDKAQVYKCRAADFADTKASQLGVYLPGHLGMDDGENVFSLVLPGDYRGEVLFFFENGKCARVPLESYATKTNRKRLTGAYCDKSPLRALLVLTEEQNVAVFSTEGRALVFNTALLAPKTSRATQGVAVMTLKPKFRLERAAFLADTTIQNLARYRMRSIPAAGALLREEDRGERQMTLLDGAEENTK